MKKRLLFIAATIMVLTLLLTACGDNSESSEASSDDELVLRMGSWRSDDVEQMTAYLAEYSRLNPGVSIRFEAINPQDFNSVIRLQLENGTAPDIIYSRSFATGRELFESGFFADISDLPGLQENFTDSNRAPWTASDGTTFAVPFIAVSHGVYYNRDIFAEHNLSVPNTWDEFIAVCRVLLDNGVTPLANGTGEEWDILETLFSAMIVNYVGGADQRVLYERGERRLNDENFVAAFTDLSQLSEFLPNGFEAVTYNDSQVLFSLGSAAMFVDGSWSLSVYDDVPFDWGVFAVPARVASDTAICFQSDVGMAMNAATEHPDEVRAFLEWIATQEGADAGARYLPTGFFSMSNFEVTLESPQANEFLALNEGRVTDSRFMWSELIDLYTPMNQAVIAVLRGTLTPQEAADSLAAAFDAR